MSKREIKFMAWDKEDKKMHRVIAIHCGVNSVRVPIKRFPYSQDMVGLDVIEYIGIKYDEVEIYESYLFDDLFGKQNEDERIKVVGEVVFDRGAFVLRFDNVGRQFPVCDLNDTTRTISWREPGSLAGKDSYYQIDNIKLIGNEFQNPELLKT